MDDLLHSDLNLANLKDIPLLQMIPLIWQRFHNQPKRPADFRKLIDLKSILLLPKPIFLPQLTHIYHHWWHNLLKFRVIGQQRLILCPQLYYPYLFEHYVNDLGLQLLVSQIKVKQIVVCFFPTFYYQASMIRVIIDYTGLFITKVWQAFFMALLLPSAVMGISWNSCPFVQSIRLNESY